MISNVVEFPLSMKSFLLLHKRNFTRYFREPSLAGVLEHPTQSAFRFMPFHRHSIAVECKRTLFLVGNLFGPIYFAVLCFVYLFCFQPLPNYCGAFIFVISVITKSLQDTQFISQCMLISLCLCICMHVCLLLRTPGQLPESIGALRNLKTLLLAGNRFEGKVLGKVEHRHV